MKETTSILGRPIQGYIPIPRHIHRDGQIAVNAVGDCMSTRPITPVLEGDKLIIHSAKWDELNNGDLIVFLTNKGAYTKEFIRKTSNDVYVRSYHPSEIYRIAETNIRGLFKIDAIVRGGEVVKAETNKEALPIVVPLLPNCC